MNENGMTFIELTIVILIIGLILAMAAPNYMNFLKSTKTGSTARRLAGYITYLKEKAVRDNTKYVLVIDLDENCYWAARELPESQMPIEYYYSTPDERMRMRYPESKDPWLKRMTLDPGITIAAVLDAENQPQYQNYRFIPFFPDGTAERTTIYIKGASQDFVTVYIKPFTGRPEIYDGAYEAEPLPRLEEQEE
jgi:prepilin-type N-terminal cleavage/methylation domain-containing protein